LLLLSNQCKLDYLTALIRQEYDVALRKKMARIIIDCNNMYNYVNNSPNTKKLGHDFWQKMKPIYSATLNSTKNKSYNNKTTTTPFFIQSEIEDFSTDVCLIIGELEFHSHKLFLSLFSDYFKSMFNTVGNFSEISKGEKEKNKIIVEIKDIQPEIFYYILEFIYTCELKEIDDNSIVELLSVADRFLMQSLKNLCARQIEKFVEVSNAVEILQIGEMFNSVRLREYCEDFIAANLSDLLDNKELLDYLAGNGASVKFLKEKIKDFQD